MALSQGRSTEVTSIIKLYTGYDAFKVLGVNPDLDTIKSWGVNYKNQPEYTRIDDNGVKRADIVVWIKSVSIPEFITHVDFNLANKKNETDKDGVHKTQMIDRFGNTAWLTDDEIRNKTIPMNKNGKKQPFYPETMRPCRRGEAELTKFFKLFCNVEDSHRYKDTGKGKEWVMSDSAFDNANYMFEEIGKYFDGNVEELRGQVTIHAENTIQLLCGVQSGKDGRMFQTVYPSECYRAAAGDVGPKFSKEIAARKSKGGLKGHDYTFDKLQVWNVEPSSKEEVDNAVE